MIDMNDWLKSWDAYYTPAQTLGNGNVAWACLVGGGIMTLVFAVLAVVSFLRHGARGIPLVAPFAIGTSAALFLRISDGLRQLPKVGADDTKAATATVSAARKRPDGFGDLLRLYTYLNDLYERKAPWMGGQAGRALGAASQELAGMP